MRLVTRVFLLMILGALLLPVYALAQDGVIAQAYATVNVRRGPGTQYDIIGQLTSGNEVQITGRSDEESNWLRISYSGSEGWVAYFTVSVLGNAEQLPIVAARPDAEVPLVRATATPVAVLATSDVYITAYRAVNVRSGPGTEYVVVGTLEPGSTADVTGRSGDSEWLRIDFDGDDGWVAFFVVTLTGLLEDVNVVPVAAGAATATPDMTVTVVTRYNVNLRDDPALHSSIVVLIPFGTELDADARSDANDTWVRVTFENQTGWLIRTLVDARGDLDKLPIVRS